MVSHKKAVVLMSGGVDSTASALIMRQKGYDVIGITLDMTCDFLNNISNFSSSVSEYVKRARSIANYLNIDHRVVKVSDLFKRAVIVPFIDIYSRGQTPNPCVICNPKVKFKIALDVAREIGADIIVSGHYAGIGRYKGRKAIVRGAFLDKEQSYFLWGLDREVIERAEFPVGRLSKYDVREIVREAGISALRGESQDVCFLRDISVGDFIGHFVRQREGEIIDTSGNILGRHRGIAYYTVGQREGLGIGGSGPYYVISIDAENNRIVVGREEELYRDTIEIESLNVNGCEIYELPEKVDVQIRYRLKPLKATIVKISGDRIKFSFDVAVKGIAPGQSAVFYDGDVLLGGGVIDNPQ
ncbi:MAG: tRNA 2-thiouridine(34) synthase MnmA [bacterium]